jgi:hypothetical protein
VDDERAYRFVSDGGDVCAWIEQASSIHLRAADPSGDPVELTAAEACEIAGALIRLAERLRQLEQA